MPAVFSLGVCCLWITSRNTQLLIWLAIQCFNEILNEHNFSGNGYIPFLSQVRKWSGGVPMIWVY
jgi:hypothetical protein